MIDISTWKKFKVSNLFEILNGNYTPLENLKKDDDGINVISVTNENNGVVGRYKRIPSMKIYSGKKLTWGKQAPHLFYQEEEFVTNQSIYMLDVSEISMYSALFVSTIINKLICPKYDYSNNLIGTRMAEEEIPLPVTSDGSPDWQYMESYMQNLWDKCEVKFEKREFNQTIDSSVWKKFKISDLFEVKACKPYSANQLQAGNTNYVTRTAENNGITGYVNAEGKQLNDGNCISIGAVGYKAFYQANPFIAGTGITSLRHDKMSKYSALFICAILNKKINEYSYDNERTYGKVKNEEIILPVTSDGIPDWQYMEDFMRGISNKYIITINGKVIE